MPQLTEPRGTAALHLIEVYAAPTELACTLLIYGAPVGAARHPYGLPNPNWATLHPTELRCTLMSCAAT